MTKGLIGVAGLVIMFLTGFVSYPEDKIVFLDVGQGDATLIQSKTIQILIDGGPDGRILQSLGAEMPWFDREIEILVLTHPDKDHLAGLLHVLDRYKVQLVMMPRFSHDSDLFEAWLAKLETKGVIVKFADFGQVLEIDDLKIENIWPDDQGEVLRGESNNVSIVQRVDWGEMSWLLTGDLERRGEKELKGDLDVEVLKVGHHGSNTSTYPELLKRTTPAVAVISSGVENRYGHPHEKVLQRLSGLEILRTDEIGNIGFVKNGHDWLIRY